MNVLSWSAGACAAVLVYVVGFAHGSSRAVAVTEQLEREQLRRAFEQGRALGEVREKVVTEYVDRIQVVEKQGATIVKEVPVYVSKAADAACPVPAGFVRLHDAASGNLPAPEPAGAADEAASGVALSAVAATVGENYTDCHANAEQLKQLQAWVSESASIINQEKPHE